SVARKAPRNAARSSSPTKSAACAASETSAGETRSPFCRSSPTKSSRRSSIGAHASVPRMWMLLLAGGLLVRGQPGLDAVRPQAISAHVRFLADDLLEGRYSGSRGHALAERYVISQLAALGVKPAGDGGGWLQQVPLRQAKTDGSVFSLDGAEIAGAVIAGDGGSSREIEGPLVFVGYAQDRKSTRLNSS